MIQITSSPFWAVISNIAKSRGDGKLSPSVVSKMFRDPLPPKPVRAILRIENPDDKLLYKYFIIDLNRKKFDSADNTAALEKNFNKLKDSYLITNLSQLPYVDGVNHKIIPISDRMAAMAVSLLEKNNESKRHS